MIGTSRILESFQRVGEGESPAGRGIRISTVSSSLKGSASRIR